MRHIEKYKLSKDKVGLLVYFRYQGKLSYWHIHSNEMTKLEKWIRKLLIKTEKEKR
jgi:hypothetical protein